MKSPRMAVVLTLTLMFSTGCRTDVDRLADSLRASGMQLQQNSAGEIIRIETGPTGMSAELRAATSQLSWLEGISLSGSSVSAADLMLLIKLPRLNSLDLSYCRLEVDDFKTISRFANLKTLMLNGNQLQKEQIELISQLSGLRVLSLMDSPVSHEDAALLKARLSGCLIVR